MVLKLGGNLEESKVNKKATNVYWERTNRGPDNQGLVATESGDLEWAKEKEKNRCKVDGRKTL